MKTHVTVRIPIALDARLQFRFSDLPSAAPQATLIVYHPIGNAPIGSCWFRSPEGRGDVLAMFSQQGSAVVKADVRGRHRISPSKGNKDHSPNCRPRGQRIRPPFFPALEADRCRVLTNHAK